MGLMDMFTEVWAFRALMASCMVGVMCGALGAFIVLRNMSMIGDALSHAILPGVVVAFVIFGYSSLGFFVGAVIAGLIAAVAITWIQQRIKTKNDAAIGIVFTAMFSFGVIGISRVSRSGGVHLDLKDFLFGNILGVSDQDILMTGIVSLFVILSIVVLYRYLFVSTFQPVIAQTMGISVNFIHYYLMLLLSFAVVASLQTVGVILVVAMLITPASTALLISDKLKNVVWISAAIGLISAFLGLYIAMVYDTTPGPAMAVAATFIYLLAAFFAPRKGMIAKWRNKRIQKSKIAQEDILKQAFKLHLLKKLSLAELSKKTKLSISKIKTHIPTLSRKGWLSLKNGVLSLTEKGSHQANNLVRAHRLWESYLVNKMGLSDSQIHDDAEKFEHLLTEELLDELDATLGYPELDPHGSPIPAKESYPKISLMQIEINEEVKIASRQIGEEVTHELWKLGLLPTSEITLLSKDATSVFVKHGEEEHQIPSQLAAKISIYSSSVPI